MMDGNDDRRRFRVVSANMRAAEEEAVKKHSADWRGADITQVQVVL